jgi:hypothetical protein
MVLLSIVVAPAQTVYVPAIAGGVAWTVTVLSTRQPSALYEIVAVPAASAFARPDTEVKFNFSASLLFHTPPLVALENVVAVPVHKIVSPVMGATNGTIISVSFTPTHPQPFLDSRWMAYVPGDANMCIGEGVVLVRASYTQVRDTMGEKYVLDESMSEK